MNPGGLRAPIFKGCGFQRLYSHITPASSSGYRKPSISHARGEMLRKRLQLHEKIYKEKFENLPFRSEEWYQLAKSGSVWRDYFKPFSTVNDGIWQQTYKFTLDHLDYYVRQAGLNNNQMLDSIKVQLAHQSASLEGGHLNTEDSLAVYGYIKDKSSCFTNTPVLFDAPPTVEELLRLPAVVNHLNQVDRATMTTDLIEFRNIVIAQEYTLQKIIPAQDFNLDECKHLHFLLMRDTAISRFYGRSSTAGQYRPIVMEARGRPLTIYPYLAEIPENMRLLFAWKDEYLATSVDSRSVHPLLFSCRFFLAFLHIHPFLDGNGRTGRMLFSILLMKFGYFPVLFQNIKREAYREMIYQAQQHNPDSFFSAVIDDLLYKINTDLFDEDLQ